MRTPKKFTDNLNKKIITDAMIGECLFSVNKRAKNYRDKERQYSSRRFDRYNNEETNREKKEYYYQLKEKMLSLLLPDCIHEEEYQKRVRIYDYEPEYYQKCDTDDVIHEGYYYDRECQCEVEFVDVLELQKRYYLFFSLPTHTFHKPIREEQLKEYQNINIVPIGSLNTFGQNVNDLISMQFVKKLMDLIETGDYTYEKESVNKQK